MDQVLPYVLALAPSIGVGFLFYLVIKAIIEGDRKERLAQSRWEAHQASLAADADPVDADSGSDAAPGPDAARRP